MRGWIRKTKLQPNHIQLSSWPYGSSSHLKGCYRCYRGCVHLGSEAHGAMSRQIRHSIGRASHQQRENLAGKAEICRDVKVLEGRWPLITQTQTHVLYCILVLFHPCLFSIHLSSFLFLPSRLLFITFPYLSPWPRLESPPFRPHDQGTGYRHRQVATEGTGLVAGKAEHHVTWIITQGLSKFKGNDVFEQRFLALIIVVYACQHANAKYPPWESSHPYKGVCLLYRWIC